MKLAHRPRIASTTKTLISKQILLSIDQFYLRKFKRIGTPSTPNIARINNLVLLSDRSLCIILVSPLIRISALAQRLECATDNRMFTGSNHSEVVWNLFSISFTPLNFASVFRKSPCRRNRPIIAHISRLRFVILSRSKCSKSPICILFFT